MPGLVVILLVTACAAPAAEIPSTTLAVTSSTVGIQNTTTTEIPVATDAVPDELKGSWKSQPDDETSERVCLSMGGNNYSHSICGDSVTLGGTLSFETDTVTFVSSMQGCPGGVGVYRWEFDGETLSLTQIDPPDECNIRRDQLNGASFTR